MLRISFAVLAVVLAGGASAAGWRNLQIDASSEAAFYQSVATLQRKLSPSRRVAFMQSLEDIKRESAQRATAEQREYTTADYLQELHGLGYEEIVKLTDPTGGRAAAYRRTYYYARAMGGTGRDIGNARSINPLWIDNSVYSTDRIPYRGWTDLTGSGQR